MDIYVRFFLSLLNARSPCRDCNSAIIPRLRTTYRTNLFANSYFCRTSGPHAGPIPQLLPCKISNEVHTQDQFRSKLVFLPHFRSTRRTSSFANSPFCHTSGPQAGPFLQQARISAALQVHSEDHREDKFPQHLPRIIKESRDISRLPYCIMCDVAKADSENRPPCHKT